MRLTVVGLAMLAAGAASAQEIRLKGDDVVAIWRDSAAQDEGAQLIRAGVHKTNPALMMPLISCIANVGERAIVTEDGWLSSTILIISGAQSGCRGVIFNEQIDRGQ